MAPVVSVDDKDRIIKRLDASDFNIKDVEELKRIFREDMKYWCQHPFWASIYSKLLDYTELYLITRNVQGK